ncbi:hypothetical protein A2643_01115 [Candidatus Nomurabacteria bacterium RIFCSPHIGHO2_01_FULL_39_220]|uniref:26 kDa periplasmic immunogenic protein n=1 Tax=Candidatus Nomurabacteria bacterium RIFCSPLOWO2_02_FULL_40_67 TaxID=1801787 RepID=A0A1F6Y2R6_9BACT|nr:MAG: hypothetical protein UU01_C0005G0018 [Parcubacteria group bacterium GW2011_GWA2_40_37]KKS11847.1 MAG: hypothetical protein UU66_C0006G0001 [Parcubacteria group bacterium GW2011_GWB1_41_5]KKS71487.1 MAG: hypothetical protein UV43_C0035G0012 [Parcubacteria group bacterium GW2011_GWF2_42_7]OGI61579.1 MAG: hypothetical protein A2W12_03050 [Candidatus Nomurabacteria bacterium RBG_16_40_11]OGI71019.1 MAG: hypothetical protein A2643_01115 [Candidatus Nomurabacteria bacterium RIFCSPHIGHO2_01_FU
METLEQNKNKLFKVSFILIVILSAYFAVKIFSEIKKDSMLGESATPATISFYGHGEVKAVPDIANISFTISKVGQTVKEAQDKVAEVEKKALDFLKGKSIAEKDIKTINASFSPKYEYKQEICPQIAGAEGRPYYCVGKQTLLGYEASESLAIKVRNVDDVGSIMQGLGTTGVSDLNGPNFAIDDEDVLKAKARKLAIDDAKEKARVLAKDLGVRLGKITSFSESGLRYPVMYESAMIKDSVGTAPAPAELPKGENTISSDVTITYEIR